MTNAVTTRTVMVLGVNTDVGKTHITTLLVNGLRALGEATWLHKPMACGEPDDGVALRALCADGQTAATVCPRWYPEPCSPRRASLMHAGSPPTMAELLATIPVAPGWLVIEGAGGVATPLTLERDGDNAGFAAACAVPAVLVTHGDLGTISATVTAVAYCRQRGVRLLGLIVNRPRPDPRSVATQHAALDLAMHCALPVLADVAHGARDVLTARSCAAAIRTALLGTMLSTDTPWS